jgi:hypothetical protein
MVLVLVIVQEWNFPKRLSLLWITLSLLKFFKLSQLEDAQASGESEVKFQVSRDALGAVLRSMAYIREQLSGVVSFPVTQICVSQPIVP